MPPAFNLSQDQTLQFDLFCLSSVFLPNSPGLFRPGLSGSFRAFVCHSTAPGLLPPRTQHSPSNAHAYRLCFVKDRYFIRARHRLRSAKPATLAQLSCENQPTSHFFFPDSPLLGPFLALDHAPAPVAPSFWPGAVTVAWLAQAGGREFAAPRKEGHTFAFQTRHLSSSLSGPRLS